MFLISVSPCSLLCLLCAGTEAGGAGRSKPRPRALRGRQVAQLPSAASSSPGGTFPHVHQAPGGNKPTGLGSAGGKGQRNEQSKAKREAQFQVTLRFPLLVFVLFSCFGFWFLQEVGSARQAASRPRRAIIRFIQAAGASNCTRSKNMVLLHQPTDREQTTRLFCELISAHDFANHCLSCQPC